MTTYNSYEAAKIANPESDIYATKVSMGGRVEVFGVYVIIGNITSNYHICDPSKYCMTVEKFLSDGYELAMGDIVINSSGAVVDMNYSRSLSDFGVLNSASHKEFILRAAALEEKPSEKVEWVNGDECEIEMQEGVRRYLFGCECPNNQQTCIVFTKDGGGHMVMPIERLLKPETKQQREDRERLEAAYDLYESAQHEIDCIGYDSFELFKKSEVQVKFWLAIVDKTNYRKDGK